MEYKTFKQWCEDNGRLWTGTTYEEFERNARDYEAYLAKVYPYLQGGE